MTEAPAKLSLRRVARAVAVSLLSGFSAFVVSFIIFVLTVAVVTPRFDRHNPADIENAHVAEILVLSVAPVASIYLAVSMAKRLRVAADGPILLAAIVLALAAHPALYLMSVENACDLGKSWPIDIPSACR